MYSVFQILLSRIQFYIFLLGAFLGLEVPLLIFAYFKLFPRYRNLVWLFTFLIGIVSAYIVNFMIKGIIRDDYKMKILFDTRNYDKGA